MARLNWAWLLGCTAMAFAAAFSLSAVAEDRKPELSIELNRLDNGGESCRATFVIVNWLGTDLKKLSFQLVLFGKDQRLLRLISFDAGSMPNNKTVVRQFDIAGVACDTIGRALLNAISQCDGEGLDPDVCLSRTRTASRAGVVLAY